MKRVIVFWLNPKTGVIYNRIYTNTIFYEVGKENQFDHVVLAIGVIRNKKIYTYEKGIDVYKLKEKEKIKDKLINKIINKLSKMKG